MDTEPRAGPAGDSRRGTDGKLSLMMRRRALVGLALASVFMAAPLYAQAPPPAASTLRIGVTLHPYYSWTANVVGKLPGYEVRAILPGDIDAGDYQPRVMR